MKLLRALSFVAMLLVVVGALNWGLVGFFGFDLVNYLLGAYPPADKVVYDIVGIAAVYVVLGFLFCCCGCCCKGCKCDGDCKCDDGCCGEECKPKKAVAKVAVKKAAAKKAVKAKKARK